MKKKIIRLNETELIRLVEKIVRKVNKKPLRESNPQGEFVYLELIYRTDNGGEEDEYDDEYDEDESYVSGLILSKVPKDLFDNSVRGGDIDKMSICDDAIGDIYDHVLSYHDVSINLRTKQSMSPDIDCSWSEGGFERLNRMTYEKKLINPFLSH
jgi:hypothetical protein